MIKHLTHYEVTFGPILRFPNAAAEFVGHPLLRNGDTFDSSDPNLWRVWRPRWWLRTWRRLH